MRSSDATTLARAVLTRLLEAGVTELVLAPGSRNAPLSFGAFDLAEAGAVRLHTRVDERAAGFLALGLTKVGARAAVMCTSGTAVANLHPAVLEAAHAGEPLVVVSADRPARLRGTGANQTTDQVGIFGPLVTTHDLATTEELERLGFADAGPTHLNVQLDDPLVPPDRWTPPPSDEPRVRAARERVARPEEPRDEASRREAPAADSRGFDTPSAAPQAAQPTESPRTVVVAGDDAGPPARVLAEQHGWPLLAEPTSGSRTGEHAIRCYRLLLEGDLGSRIERAVVCGHPTLSRPVGRLLARDDVEVLAAPTAGVWAERPFRVDGPADGATDVGDPGWLDEWRAADRAVARRLDALLAGEEGLTAYEVAGAVARALPAHGLLTVGASNPIRDLDLMVPRYRVGDRRKVIANRGLSGIDGVVSTAVGAALGRPGSSRAFALVGDVTFLHDAGGLVLGPEEQEPDLTVVVVNDDGGSIFATLEQGAEEYAHAFERVFGTPHRADLASLCAATRTPHLRVTSLPELEQALAMPNGGVEVVEAVVDRAGRRDLDARIRGLRP